jgi:cytochrome P450
MWRRADEVADQWAEGAAVNLLDEMRRIAILVLMDTLFDEDMSGDLKPLWDAILRTIQYISPGIWLVWPNAPRPGYARALRQMDAYLFSLIQARRERPDSQSDLVGGLIAAGLSDDLIRDQLLTLFIAGHDTSTALLAWALVLLSLHPEALERVQAEVDQALGTNPPAYTDPLPYLDQVIKETLRLYPPIHLGSRIAAADLEFQGYIIPAHTRVLYSIYLSHRHKAYWTEPDKFDPDRFTPENNRAREPYVYLPFGGGARNCVGFAFTQVEARIVLARLIQRFEFRLLDSHVRPRMRATLEPHSGVIARVHRRR